MLRRSIVVRYFVDPRPDELFYSIIARYKEHTFATDRAVSREVFLSRHELGHNYSYLGRIGAFCENIGKQFKLCLDDIVDNHTLTPLCYRFIDEARIQFIKNELRKNRRVHAMERLLDNNTKLKYCPECLKEDIEKYYEPYWHRSHNVFDLIHLCVKHNCFLEPDEPIYRQRYAINLYSANSLRKNKTITRKNSNELLLIISKRITSLLTDRAQIDKNNLMNLAIQNKLAMKATRKIQLNTKRFNGIKKDIPLYRTQIENDLKYHSNLNRLLAGDCPLFYALLEHMLEG